MLESVKRTRSFSAAGVLLTAACGGSEAKQIDKPTPPDMAPLVAIYEAPTGNLDEDTAALVFDSARELAARIEALGIDRELMDTVQDAVDSKQSGETETNGALGTQRSQQTEGDGYLVVTRICNGWGAEPVPDAANGHIELTVGFTESQVDAVTFGAAVLCQYRVGDSQVLLRGPGGSDAGSAGLSFGRSVPFDEVAQSKLLFDLEIVAELDGGEVSVEFDFRLDPTQRSFELRIPVSGGDLIGIISADLFAGVRAANGDFVCSEASRTCTAGSQTVAF